MSCDGTSWREKLLNYNQSKSNNPLGLLPAVNLYRPPVYASLAASLPMSQLFILSAGWGLIRADFLTPAYDITFSAQAKPISRRKKSAIFDDICALGLDDDQPVTFFGGKDYVPLFCRLTAGYRGERTVFYNAAIPPKAPGCVLRKYPISPPRNWHYKCAQAYVDGQLQ